MNMTRAKKIAFWAAGALVFMWFALNGALYWYSFSDMFSTDEALKILNLSPKPMAVTPSANPGEMIYLEGVSMVLPVPEAGAIKTRMNFFEHKPVVLMMSGDRDAEPAHVSVSFKKVKLEGPLIRQLEEIYYSTPQGYSSWNLPANLGLMAALITKGDILFGPDSEVYHIRAEELEGFLMTGRAGTGFTTSLHVQAGNTEIHAFMLDENGSIEKARDFIASIRPAGADAARSIKQRIDSGDSAYPHEALLVSLMSVEGPKVELIEEMLDHMEVLTGKGEKLEQYLTEMLKAEIEYIQAGVEREVKFPSFSNTAAD